MYVQIDSLKIYLTFVLLNYYCNVSKLYPNRHFNKILVIADGRNKQAWAANLKSSDYELLCPDGERVAVDEYVKCNLLQAPSHMVCFYYTRYIIFLCIFFHEFNFKKCFN